MSSDRVAVSITSSRSSNWSRPSSARMRPSRLPFLVGLAGLLGLGLVLALGGGFALLRTGKLFLVAVAVIVAAFEGRLPRRSRRALGADAFSASASLRLVSRSSCRIWRMTLLSDSGSGSSPSNETLGCSSPGSSGFSSPGCCSSGSSPGSSSSVSSRGSCSSSGWVHVSLIGSAVAYERDFRTAISDRAFEQLLAVFRFVFQPFNHGLGLGPALDLRLALGQARAGRMSTSRP
jgi:hypothetical protein